MLKGRDILSILDLTTDDLDVIFREADRMLEAGLRLPDLLKGKVLATAFFEPSTRTKLSFQSAMLRLGGGVIDLPPDYASSRFKGESLADTIRMLDAYSDIIVIRHKIEGMARFAAEIAEAPVINGGDGTRDHPTQAIIDLYTIRRELGRLNGLTIGVLGDLRYGRAARSFILGVLKYRPDKIYLVSPTSLKPRKEVLEYLDKDEIPYEETDNLGKVLPELDVLYVTRIQRERFPDPAEYERVKGSYRIAVSGLQEAKQELIILHPLPRVDELDYFFEAT